MTDRPVSTTPWQRLPAPLVPALRGRMAALVDAVAGEITGSVYADVKDAKVTHDVRRGVGAALERFADLVGTDEAALPAGVRETFVDLGAAEAREDRPPEMLLAALRTSARVMLRETSEALAQARPLTTEDLIDLSDAVTAYVDELVAATTDGFTLQVREQAGERDRRRRLLAEVLVRGSAPERAVVTAAEGVGWLRIDDIVPVLLPAEQTRQAQFRYRDDAVVLERERDSVLLMRHRRPATRELLERSLTAQLAPAVDSTGDPLFAEDHLATLALRGEQAAFALLTERRLAPFAALREATRERHLETLHSWLRHWGSRSAVADELRVHPQTVSYRIRQLRELLGDDLDDADARFELTLVLADRSRR
jgi:hypothetical protein